jgi:hypothetical protein
MHQAGKRPQSRRSVPRGPSNVAKAAHQQLSIYFVTRSGGPQAVNSPYVRDAEKNGMQDHANAEHKAQEVLGGAIKPGWPGVRTSAAGLRNSNSSIPTSQPDRFSIEAQEAHNSYESGDGLGQKPLILELGKLLSSRAAKRKQRTFPLSQLRGHSLDGGTTSHHMATS